MCGSEGSVNKRLLGGLGKGHGLRVSPVGFCVIWQLLWDTEVFHLDG